VTVVANTDDADRIGPIQGTQPALKLIPMRTLLRYPIALTLVHLGDAPFGVEQRFEEA
jgi:hypothetical protein